MMRRRALIFLGVALLALLWAAPSQAMVLTVDADTLLSNDSNRGPTVTHGSASQMQMRDLAGVRVRIAYFRFDITGVDSSLFGTATLGGTFRDSSKNGASSGSTFDVYGLDDGAAGNDWDESTVSYSNAAGVDNSSLLGEYAFDGASMLGTIAYDGADVQPLPFASNTTDLDLTAFLNADTDGLVTFLMIDANATGDEYYIDSLEGNAADGHGPMTMTFIPEPSTTLLMLGGLGLFSLLRRRK
jgi:hypothetical protein